MLIGENIETLIDIGASQLYIRCCGQGKPTVVIEAGLGDGADSWIAVQQQISTFTRVCTYDRAGVGKSTPGTKPRTSRQMSSELSTLLEKAQMEGPYVLVGHSLGALNVQLFAAEYPQSVAGLVLVDPSFPGMFARLETALGKFWMLLWNSQFTSDAEGMTKMDFETSCNQVAAARLPTIPIVVISAGQPIQLPPILNSIFPGAKMVRVLQEGHAALAKQFNHGQHLITEKSSHASIIQDNMIVDTIHQVVDSVR